MQRHQLEIQTRGGSRIGWSRTNIFRSPIFLANLMDTVVHYTVFPYLQYDHYMSCGDQSLPIP